LSTAAGTLAFAGVMVLLAAIVRHLNERNYRAAVNTD